MACAKNAGKTIVRKCGIELAGGHTNLKVVGLSLSLKRFNETLNNIHPISGVGYPPPEVLYRRRVV